MAINFSSKTIPSNADMPCKRRVYEFRDFKSDSWQKLWLYSTTLWRRNFSVLKIVTDRHAGLCIMYNIIHMDNNIGCKCSVFVKYAILFPWWRHSIIAFPNSHFLKSLLRARPIQEMKGKPAWLATVEC